MSREHIALCLAFLFLRRVSLHYVSLVSSCLSLRPPSLCEVTRGQGLSQRAATVKES